MKGNTYQRDEAAVAAAMVELAAACNDTTTADTSWADTLPEAPLPVEGDAVLAEFFPAKSSSGV